MNIDNRRLRTIQQELRAYNHLLNQCEKEADRQIFQGKIRALEREQNEILARYGVLT